MRSQVSLSSRPPYKFSKALGSIWLDAVFHTPLLDHYYTPITCIQLSHICISDYLVEAVNGSSSHTTSNTVDHTEEESVVFDSWNQLSDHIKVSSV